jgi:hypothetical protein
MPAAAQKIPTVPQELRVAKDYANWHLADLRVSANVRFAPLADDPSLARIELEMQGGRLRCRRQRTQYNGHEGDRRGTMAIGVKV